MTSAAIRSSNRGGNLFTLMEIAKISLLTWLTNQTVYVACATYVNGSGTTERRFDEKAPECLYEMPTAVCKEGKPVWEALHVRSWAELDCLGRETVTDIVELGKGGFTDWAQMCAGLRPEESGRPLPATLKDVTIFGYECITATNKTVFVETEGEVELARLRGAHRCVHYKTQGREDLNPCEEDAAASACTGEEFDWRMLVGALRNDCLSRMVRDVFVEYAGDPPDDLLPQCGQAAH